MKKQFLVFATIMTVVFVSCSKQGIETPQTNNSEELATATQRPILTSPGDLNKGLLGLYEFNGNLVEKTGKLMTGSPSIANPVYTNDRKGNRGKAIKFNGTYDVSLGYVPHSAKMSVAAWVKYDSANSLGSIFVYSQSDGPNFVQALDQYYAYNNGYGTPYIGSGSINDQWHFLVATIDGTTLRFYIDGNLVGSVASPDVEKVPTQIYMLGFGNTSETNWNGAIDDLRFYSRTLSPAEVIALFNL